MTLVDQITERLGEGVTLLATALEGKVLIVCKATKGAMARGAHAGNIVKEVAAICGGGGGGKPNFARAGGKDPAKIAEAVAAVPEIVARQVGE
jgi:alanyl-tRNA synthetase